VNEIDSLWIKSGCHNKFSNDEMNFIFYGWKMDIHGQTLFMNNKLNELFKYIYIYMIKFLIYVLGSIYDT